MLFFCHRDGFKNLGNILKPFFNGDFGKAGIHIGIFVIFTGGRFLKVFQCRADRTGWKGTAYGDLAACQ